MKINYAKWFEVAQMARRARPYVKYRDGVERAAALAAVEQQEHGCGMPACIDAVERAFESMRVSINPNWDGSIA